MRAAVLFTVSALLSTATANAQTIETVRNDIRESLRQAKFASSLSGLVLLSEEIELSGASYDIDSGASTEVSAFVLPFASTLRPFERPELGLYVEGVVGYSRATESTPDLFAGTLPGLETAVDAEWESLGALAGAGPRFDATDELSVAALATVGVAHIENDADYSGPGAATTAALLDGIAFNWDALVINVGASTRLDWEREFGARRKLVVIARYDARWTQTVETDDPAQDFATRMQLATVRGEYRTPTGFDAMAMPVDARLHVGARRFVEGDLFGVQEIYEAGATLELLTGDRIPIAKGVTFGGAWFFGENLRGWTVGLGLSF